jgi:hypothetical protein
MIGIASQSKGRPMRHGVVADPMPFGLGPFGHAPRLRVRESFTDNEESRRDASSRKDIEDARRRFRPRTVVEREREPRHGSYSSPLKSEQANEIASALI